MDMRTGDVYPTLAAALEAGVPREQLAEVEPVIVRITSHGLERINKPKKRRR